MVNPALTCCSFFSPKTVGGDIHAHNFFDHPLYFKDLNGVQCCISKILLTKSSCVHRKSWIFVWIAPLSVTPLEVRPTSFTFHDHPYNLSEFAEFLQTAQVPKWWENIVKKFSSLSSATILQMTDRWWTDLRRHKRSPKKHGKLNTQL